MKFYEIIKEAVNSLCTTLNMYLPGDVTKIKYGDDKSDNLHSRMCMAVYIELIKAGIITDQNYNDE
jgi:hypothetical protein